MAIPKSYRYDKLPDLAAICGISSEEQSNLLAAITAIFPSETLQNVLDRNLRIPMKNEKAKSELIVMPVFVEVLWQFLKLEGHVLYIDSQRYKTANLPQLQGAIQKGYDFYK